MPDDVAQLIIAEGPVVLEEVLEHECVKGISFTGSTEVGNLIERMTSGKNIRLQLEMGGKNAMVVLKDANIEMALEAVRKAAFTCSGQWCLSTSRVIVEAEMYDIFCKKLKETVLKLHPGIGFNPKADFGVITTENQKKILVDAINNAEQEGAKLLVGGKSQDKLDGNRVNYVEPTDFYEVMEDMELFQDEIFGPVVAIIKAKDAQDALRLANATPFGLSFSIYTVDTIIAELFMDKIQCGIVHHNRHTGIRHPSMPVSGWKESGRGVPECGIFTREFYTKPKAIYI